MFSKFSHFYQFISNSHSILRVFKRITTLDERPRVIFDSNKILGTYIEHEYSPNGQYLALTIGVENQNSHKILVIDVRTGRPHGNCLHVFSSKKIAWSGDSDGFFVYVNILYDNKLKSLKKLEKEKFFLKKQKTIP